MSSSINCCCHTPMPKLQLVSSSNVVVQPLEAIFYRVKQCARLRCYSSSTSNQSWIQRGGKLCVECSRSIVCNVVVQTMQLLLTHQSFVYPHLLNRPDKDDANKRTTRSSSTTKKNNNVSHRGVDLNSNPYLHGLGGPTLPSTLLTVTFYVGVLFIVEHVTRYIIGTYLIHLDPILEIEVNRHIIARHMAVDFFSLVVCATVAIANRRVCTEIITHFFDATINGKTSPLLMNKETYEERIFAYHPAAQRLTLLFFTYQVKNMYDTIYWNDGIEFVLHHILAGAAAWGGMYPGCCHFYALFYFGFSEISTAILCLLSNFDPKYGVAGLEDVFPRTKLFLGAMFVTSFVICRLILWPYATYYFARDTMLAIKSNVPRADGRRGYLWVIYCCCVGLSLIQVLFVVMIVQTGKEEIAKFMKL